MERLDEINSTIERVLVHEGDRRPRLTKAHYATILEALVIYSDILEIASELPKGKAIQFLTERVPNLNLRDAKNMLK